MANVQPIRSPQGETEASARVNLAALYRLADHYGWSDLIYNHISARVPGEAAFLVKAHAVMFDEVTASNLMKVKLDGSNMDAKGFVGDRRINRAGFTIHSGVYKARPDANCVLHTHTPAGAGVSLIRNGLRPISQDALSVWDELAYHEYGVPASVEECEALAVACGKGSCVVLHNHGLLTFGDTVQGAFMRMYTLQRACELEVIARQMGEEPVAISNFVIGKAAERMKKRRATPEYGLNEFRGLARQAERKGFNWKR